MEAKIKPRDLRLGCLLNFEGQPMEVAQINPDNTIRFWREKETGTTCGCFHIYNELIEPIPLSEDWLRRCDGFKKDDADNILCDTKNGHVVLTKMINDWNFTAVFYWDDTDEPEHRYMIHPIKYLHQLQNAWPVLTGSELTIKDINNI